MTKPVTPLLTVDIIVCKGNRNQLPEVLLIKRKNEPFGWALPGGFVEVGESTSAAACRELLEETGLKRESLSLVGVNSDPNRDPRGHTVSIIYETIGLENEKPVGADDAAEAKYFLITRLPEQIAFDHRETIEDWFLDLANKKINL